MSDIRCSRDGIKCDGCPILDKCEHIEVTEEINPFALYQKGRADAIDECIAKITEFNSNGYEVWWHTMCNILEQLKEKADDSSTVD